MALEVLQTICECEESDILASSCSGLCSSLCSLVISFLYKTVISSVSSLSHYLTNWFPSLIFLTSLFTGRQRSKCNVSQSMGE